MIYKLEGLPDGYGAFSSCGNRNPAAELCKEVRALVKALTNTLKLIMIAGNLEKISIVLIFSKGNLVTSVILKNYKTKTPEHVKE